MPKRYNYIIRQPVDEELPAIQALRHRVLDPARLYKSDTTLSEKDYDPKNIHMAAFIDNSVVATLRIDKHASDSGLYLVEKVATDSNFRGLGLAAMCMSEAEKLAIDRGASAFQLSSRIDAIGFYKRLGYQIISHIFVSPDGVNNMWMEKKARV